MATGGLQYYFSNSEIDQKNGSLLVFPPAATPISYNVQSMTAYSSVQSRTTPVMSNFYFDNTTSMFWIDALVPFTSGGQVVGLTGVSSSTVTFNSILSTINISPNSAIYMVTNVGMYMIGSSLTDEKLTSATSQMLRLSQSSISWVAKIGSMLEANYGTTITSNQIVSGGRYYTDTLTSYYVDSIAYNDVRGVNWTILVFIRTDDFLGPVNRLRQTVGVTEGVIVVVSIIVSLALAFMITAPLDFVRKELQRLRLVDLTPLPETKGFKKFVGFIQKREIFSEIASLCTELRSLKMAMRGFVKYVPIELVRTFLNHPQTDTFFRPFVSSREITIMFVDFYNFSSIAEKMGDSKQLIDDILTVYFEEISKIIKQHDGTLDKYIGSIVMSFFNAPDNVDDFVMKTCKAANDINSACKRMTDKFQNHGLPPVNVRIGLHVGECLVGNLGSQVRINYTGKLFSYMTNIAKPLEMQ
jgi:GGDEF domain-containing protein